MEQPSNFTFLQSDDPLFFQLAHSAELYLMRDPNTALIKLRQFGEAIAQSIAVRYHIDLGYNMTQVDLINEIDRAMGLDPTIRSLFHQLRIKGNKATHEFESPNQSALDALRMARQLAIWYHRAFGKGGKTFDPPAFVTPRDPTAGLKKLEEEINRLQNEIAEKEKNLDDQLSIAESNEALARLHAKEKEEYQRIAEMMDQLAREQEENFKVEAISYEKRLEQLEAELSAQDYEERRLYRQRVMEQLLQSNAQIHLEEADVRIILDQALRDAGWEADSKKLSYNAGAKPTAGKNRAIAHWPLPGSGGGGSMRGSIDYLLFCGLTPIAIIEAKEGAIDVAGKIEEAISYATDLPIDPSWNSPWDQSCRALPWQNGEEIYTIPFVYSANGRPYFKDYPERSGIWFQDLRHPSFLAHALDQFHHPNQLLARLKMPCDSDATIQNGEDFNALNLRDYQQTAIEAVESQLMQHERKQWVVMAPGTGKTRTIFALIHRLLKQKSSNNILLIVDRTALGMQMINHFKQFDSLGGASLTALHKIRYLDPDLQPEESNISLHDRQHSNVNESVQSKGCAHSDERRGLTIASLEAVEQAIKEGTLRKAQFDYLIVDEFYRQAESIDSLIDRFQAIFHYFNHASLIGFSATDSKSLQVWLNPPIYRYRFAEAVIDGWLVDHDPPIRYITKLAESGIYFGAGAIIDCYHNRENRIEQITLDEGLQFSLVDFNDRVMNESFNRVICEQLAKTELNPFSDEKSLIFCQNNRHADMVKRLLDELFQKIYGEQYNHRMTAKITRESNDPDQLIHNFRSEQYPNIAITVDLLTAEIEIPRVRNLLFLRVIESNALYERMIGRASRHCDAIDKEAFRIFDAMDNGENDDERFYHQHNRINHQAREGEEKEKGEKGKQGNERHVGEKRHDAILNSGDYTVISRHHDEWIRAESLYPNGATPSEFIERFNGWIQERQRADSRMATLIDAPRELTRKEYDHLRLLAYDAGFSERYLESAYADIGEPVVTATLMGYIRHAYFNEPLIAFAERLNDAMALVFQSQNWSHLQRDWLNQIALYLQKKVIIDQTDIDQFAIHNGGYERLDAILDHQLHTILITIDEALWPPLDASEHLGEDYSDLNDRNGQAIKQREMRSEKGENGTHHTDQYSNHDPSGKRGINKDGDGIPLDSYSLEKYRRIGLITLLIFGGLLLMGILWNFF